LPADYARLRCGPALWLAQCEGAGMSKRKFISWAEAFERVGRAKFGDHWITELTGHEDWVLMEGCFGAAGAAEWEATQAKDKEMEYQHRQVFAWLKQNCFSKKQHTEYELGYLNGHHLIGHQRVEQMKFFRAAFDRKLAAAFPGNAQQEPQQTPEPAELKRASSEMIRGAIRTVYAAETRPPNIVQLPKKVQQVLKVGGYRASQRQIQEIGTKEFKDKRRDIGKTYASEQKKPIK
jgi:hypothetical protein